MLRLQYEKRTGEEDAQYVGFNETSTPGYP